MTQAERDRLVALKKAKKKLITQTQAADEPGSLNDKCGCCGRRQNFVLTADRVISWAFQHNYSVVKARRDDFAVAYRQLLPPGELGGP